MSKGDACICITNKHLQNQCLPRQSVILPSPIHFLLAMIPLLFCGGLDLFRIFSVKYNKISYHINSKCSEPSGGICQCNSNKVKPRNQNENGDHSQYHFKYSRDHRYRRTTHTLNSVSENKNAVDANEYKSKYPIIPYHTQKSHPFG